MGPLAVKEGPWLVSLVGRNDHPAIGGYICYFDLPDASKLPYLAAEGGSRTALPYSKFR